MRSVIVVPAVARHTLICQSQWRHLIRHPVFLAMHFLSRFAQFSGPNFGPLSIALGLTALLTSLLIPAVLAVTSMGIVALGATQATLTRFRLSPALPTIMLVHGVTYISLYAIFVCAVLYTPSMGSAHALSCARRSTLRPASCQWPLLYGQLAAPRLSLLFRGNNRFRRCNRNCAQETG